MVQVDTKDMDETSEMVMPKVDEMTFSTGVYFTMFNNQTGNKSLSSPVRE